MSMMLNKIQLKQPSFEVPQAFKEQESQYKKIMMNYYAAIKVVHTKLEILSDQLQVSSSRNPIEFIKARLKEPKSIMNKLVSHGYEKTLDGLSKITDIAGVRVVVTYLEDLYEVANALANQDDVKLINIRDYVKKPKDNGYRSLHILIEVPVFFGDKRRMTRVEVQIRTIAMDFWASLEHDIKYKSPVNNLDLKGDLKECSNIISDVEERMQTIKSKLKEIEEETFNSQQSN